MIILPSAGSAGPDLTAAEKEYDSVETIRLNSWTSFADALSRAEGEYIVLSDENCFFETEMIRSLYEAAVENKSDILLYHAHRTLFNDDSFVLEKGYNEKSIPKNKSVFHADDCKDRILSLASDMLCTRLYRKNFLIREKLAKCSSPYVFDKTAFSAARRIACKADGYVCLKGEAAHNTDRKDADFRSLSEELKKRNLYQMVEKSFLSILGEYCSKEIAKAETEKEVKSTFERITGALLPAMDLSEINTDNDPAAQIRGLEYIADTRRKYLLRRSQPVKLDPVPTDESIKVSVIIPVYNVEKYLAECLDSVCGQTLKEIEIICVNDGSTDNTLSILNEYARKNSRIQVYSQQNEGQSSARNHGLKYAKGRYIYFMDSDDILEKEALELTYARVVKDDLDLVYFDGSSFADENGPEEDAKRYSTYYTRVHPYEGVYKGCDLFAKMYANSEYRVSPCLQLIRRSLITDHNILYTHGIIHEDNIFSFKVIMLAKRAGYLHKSLFNRRVRGSSTMTSSRTYKNVIGYFVCYMEMQAFLDTLQLSDEVRSEAQMCIYRILHNARNDCKAITPAERHAYEALPEYDQISYRLHVKEIVHELLSASELRKKNKEANETIARLRNEGKGIRNSSSQDEHTSGGLRGFLNSDTARKMKDKIKGRR